MSRKPDPPGTKAPGRATDAASVRRERLARALRDNLRRRKTQARRRTEAGKGELE
jgi:hypothetical protein